MAWQSLLESLCGQLAGVAKLDDNPYLTGFVGRLTGGEVYGKHLLASAGMLSRSLRNLQA